MNNYKKWIMYTKLNMVFILVFALFYSFIWAIADNRFEEGLGIYVLIGVLWGLVLFNFVMLTLLKKHKTHNTPIPLIVKIGISLCMISIVAMIIFSNQVSSVEAPYSSNQEE